MTKSITVAGIDTANAKLNIAMLGRAESWQVENAHPGWQHLGALLLEAHIVRVGIEATGGYEKGVVAHLRTLGFEVLVLQPMQVKAHARKHKHRAKNDRIDARLIAECAADLAMPDIAPDPRLEALAPALTYLEQIEDDITRLKVRLEHAPDRRAVRHGRRHQRGSSLKSNTAAALLLRTRRRQGAVVAGGPQQIPARSCGALAQAAGVVYRPGRRTFVGASRGPVGETSPALFAE